MTPTTPLTRRTFLVASGLTAATAALAACSAGAGTGSGGSTTITGAGWDDGITDLLFGDVRTAWQKKTGDTLKPQASVPFTDYQTRFRTLIAGGSPPDVMRLNDDFLRELTDKKSIRDLSAYIKHSDVDLGDYYANVYDFATFGTQRTAQIIGTQPRVIYYNKTMFQKAGVPLPPTDWTDEGWTWDDFLAAAQALTRGPDQYGCVVVKDTGYENTFSVNNGGEGVFSKDGHRFTLADPSGYEAVQWVADLALKHKVAPSWGEIQPDQAEQQLFAAGRLGMLFGASSGASYFQQNVHDFEWDIAPVPGKVRQQQEGSMIVTVIPTKAKNPDLAWDFLNYAAGPEGGAYFAKAGICVPVNKTAAQSLPATGQPPANVKLLAQAADHNSSVNSTTATSQAVAIYRPQLEKVYIGETTAKDALTSVRTQIEALIAR